MEYTGHVKDTPALLVFGLLFISLFGWWLKRRYNGFDFTQRYGKFAFILHNY